MPTILTLHILFGLLFIFAVLIQDKGSGLSAAFGGTGTFYASQRGAAKFVHYATLVFAILFFAMALLSVLFAGTGATLDIGTPSVEGIQVEPVNE